MKNATAAATAAATLAANSQVTELEPRLENGWAGGSEGTKVEHEEFACVTNGTC